MNQNRSVPAPGEFYRHFKDKMYQIIAVASHSETGEAMVVYQALYGQFKVWVRPLEMFLDEVDREKYPQAAQTYRFERVAPRTLVNGTSAVTKMEDGAEVWPEMESGSSLDMEPVMNPYLLDFLDALDSSNYDKKLECLGKLAGHVTQKELDDIYMVMDMQGHGETVEDQLAQIKRQLNLLKKFDGERLR